MEDLKNYKDVYQEILKNQLWHKTFNFQTLVKNGIEVYSKFNIINILRYIFNYKKISKLIENIDICENGKQYNKNIIFSYISNTFKYYKKLFSSNKDIFFSVLKVDFSGFDQIESLFCYIGGRCPNKDIKEFNEKYNKSNSIWIKFEDNTWLLLLNKNKFNKFIIFNSLMTFFSMLDEKIQQNKQTLNKNSIFSIYDTSSNIDKLSLIEKYFKQNNIK